jgi:hypothetical protein
MSLGMYPKILSKRKSWIRPLRNHGEVTRHVKTEGTGLTQEISRYK